jgi:hypothetical protein
MPKYMLLLHDDPASFADVSPNEMQKIVEKYKAWGKKLREAGVWRASDKLTNEPGRVMRQGTDRYASPTATIANRRSSRRLLPDRSGLFDRRDGPNGPPVVIISAAVQRQFFGSENPVGMRVRHGKDTAEIVGDIRRAGLTDRPREIGTRMALEATGCNILWSVLRHGLSLTVIGLGLGLLAALAAAQSLASVLYGVTAADPPTLVAACTVLALATLTACYLPARRAARVDPARTIDAA